MQAECDAKGIHVVHAASQSQSHERVAIWKIFSTMGTVMLMGTRPKTTMAITAAQFDGLADDLRELADRLTKAAAVAKTQENQILACYNYPSVRKGMQLLRSFVAQVDQSRTMASMGQPLAVGDHKPRSIAKKAANKAVDSIRDKPLGRNKKQD
jgi:hypothetical protein